LPKKTIQELFNSKFSCAKIKQIITTSLLHLHELTKQQKTRNIARFSRKW